MSRRRRRIWPWILLLLTAGGGGAWWWYTKKNAVPVAPEYETVAVSQGSILKAVRASGELNPLTKVEIGSQISGTIQSLKVDFNSRVKAGDILCQLDPATYEASYAQSNAELVSAVADRDYQLKTLDRKRQLLEQKLFPQADFDKAEADFKNAEAQVLLAEARLKRAKVDLDRCAIYAPIEGVIIDRTAEIGQTIAASFNAPKLFVLANDLTKMQINAKVSEADIGQVQPKQKVRFTVDAYPEEFVGEVVQVRNAPISEENVVNYDAIIAVNNGELKLKPGMTAVVQIITGERDMVQRVPNAALRFKPPGQSYSPAADAGKPGATGASTGKTTEAPSTRKVYRKGPDGQPEPVEITVGLTDGIHTEVSTGLKAGDMVITVQKAAAGAGPVSNPFGGGMGSSRR